MSALTVSWPWAPRSATCPPSRPHSHTSSSQHMAMVMCRSDTQALRSLPFSPQALTQMVLPPHIHWPSHSRAITTATCAFTPPQDYVYERLAADMPGDPDAWDLRARRHWAEGDAILLDAACSPAADCSAGPGLTLAGLPLHLCAPPAPALPLHLSGGETGGGRGPSRAAWQGCLQDPAAPTALTVGEGGTRPATGPGLVVGGGPDHAAACAVYEAAVSALPRSTRMRELQVRRSWRVIPAGQRGRWCDGRILTAFVAFCCCSASHW
jgi:hypothetical protein